MSVKLIQRETNLGLQGAFKRADDKAVLVVPIVATSVVALCTDEGL